MLKGILNITICPQDDGFDILDVSENFRDRLYDITVNTLSDESFCDIVTDEMIIQKIINTM